MKHHNFNPWVISDRKILEEAYELIKWSRELLRNKPDTFLGRRTHPSHFEHDSITS
jgi:hypothetical protein